MSAHDPGSRRAGAGVPLALAALLLAGHVALRAGALAGLPETARLALAFASLVLLPGFAGLALGLGAPGGALLSAVRALGAGIAWNALLVLVTRMAGLPFTVLLDVAPWLAAALCAAAVLAHRRREHGGAEGRARLTTAALAAVVVAAGLASLHAAWTGGPVSYYSDSPDHIGTIRRMLQTGDAFPTDAFYRDAGPEGADPRKGLWHPQVALIAALAGVDPTEAWRKLPAVIAPCFVINLASLGARSAGSAGAAVFAWVQLLLLAGSMQWFPLRKAVFSTFLADQLCLGVAIAALIDLERPSRSGRAGAVVLGLGAIATHLYSVMQIGLMLGALGVGLALRERRFAGPVRRTLATGLAIAGLALPYLVWRTSEAYAPLNVIHTETQGMLTIAGRWSVVSPGVLWDWMGPLWILFPIAWIALWRHGRRDPAALLALTTSVGVVLVIFNPIAVSLLEPRVGYLLMRVVWMMPIGALVGWALIALGRASRGGPAGTGASPPRARIVARVSLAALLVFLLPTARDAARTWITPQRFRAIDEVPSPLRWSEAMAWMDAELPPGQVVLSDPATSYGVPMLTRHFVATLMDQHSSPSDSLALQRLIDARDALDPYGSWARTRAVIRRHAVTVLVVNDDFPEVPLLDYWSSSPAWAAAARARLALEPEAFERVYDRGGFTVYRVHDAALDSLDAPLPERPFVVPYVPGRGPIGRRISEELPVVQRLAFEQRRVVRGDTLGGVSEWRALRPLVPGHYTVSLRFDRALPGGFEPPAWIAKPARKVLERVRHERYRFREDHLPVAGAFGVDLWRPEEVVRDSFRLQVPFDVAPGWYRAEVTMTRSPHYPNLRLSDYFFDRDYYSGVALGAIEVVADRAALAEPPAPPPADFGGAH